VPERPADLPDYREPPVDEVLISVQFIPIAEFYETHAGLFWTRVRDEYPRSESQPRIESPLESANIRQAPPIQLQLIPGQGRTMLISSTDEYLIQIQNSRFIQNWRRRQAPYQRFEQVRDKFWASYREFVAFLSEEHLSKPVIQQLEVSYINWIPDMSMSEFLRPGSVAEVSISSGGPKVFPDQQSWLGRYTLSDGDDDEPLERVHVQCLPATRFDAPEAPGTQLGFIYHGTRISGISDSDLAELIDRARVIIVSAFTDLTTPSAHERWGRFK
jgi:uncharacterized protein (TIGR04255 family)